MMHDLDYLKVIILNTFAFVFSFADADIMIKAIVASITIGYTVRKWYREEKGK